jgi:hypothetical protein
MPPTYTAGNVLSAVQALDAGQESFTRAQVAHIAAMAYDAGRSSTFLEDLAETVTVWEDRAEQRLTYEQRVAARIAEMERNAAMNRLRAGLPPRPVYTGGPVPWGDVDAPYDVLSQRDRDIMAAAAKVKPVGNQAEPGTAAYIEGWLEMKATLTAAEWQNVSASLSDRTLTAIGKAHANGRHLRIVRDTGRTA